MCAEAGGPAHHPRQQEEEGTHIPHIQRYHSHIDPTSLDSFPVFQRPCISPLTPLSVLHNNNRARRRRRCWPTRRTPGAVGVGRRTSWTRCCSATRTRTDNARPSGTCTASPRHSNKSHKTTGSAPGSDHTNKTTTPLPHIYTHTYMSRGTMQGIPLIRPAPLSLSSCLLSLPSVLCSCASVKAADEEAARREEARLKPHDYILLPPTTPDQPAQLACITQVPHSHTSTYPQVTSLTSRPPRAKHVTQTHCLSPVY